jgi:hypothetical protein
VGNNTYQTGTVMKKRTEMGASQLTDNKSFKKDVWDEIADADENLCFFKRKG